MVKIVQDVATAKKQIENRRSLGRRSRFFGGSVWEQKSQPCRGLGPPQGILVFYFFSFFGKPLGIAGPRTWRRRLPLAQGPATAKLSA